MDQIDPLSIHNTNKRKRSPCDGELEKKRRRVTFDIDDETESINPSSTCHSPSSMLHLQPVEGDNSNHRCPSIPPEQDDVVPAQIGSESHIPSPSTTPHSPPPRGNVPNVPPFKATDPHTTAQSRHAPIALPTAGAKSFNHPISTHESIQIVIPEDLTTQFDVLANGQKLIISEGAVYQVKQLTQVYYVGLCGTRACIYFNIPPTERHLLHPKLYILSLAEKDGFVVGGVAHVPFLLLYDIKLGPPIDFTDLRATYMPLLRQ